MTTNNGGVRRNESSKENSKYRDNEMDSNSNFNFMTADNASSKISFHKSFDNYSDVEIGRSQKVY